MPAEPSSSNLWLSFALMTVACWGLYGIALHSGQVQMADPNQGRYKAFLWVGIAYFIVAILGPLFMLLKDGTDWVMPSKAIWTPATSRSSGRRGRHWT